MKPAIISLGLVALIAISTQAHAQSRGAPRVLGGSAAAQGEFPSIVAISLVSDSNTGNFSCGGSLIEKRYVLTAAHCVHGDKGMGALIAPAKFKVRVGSLSWRSGGQDAGVTRVISHADYNKTGRLENDIALLELDQDLNVAPMQLDGLARQNEVQPRLAGSPILMVAGWGVMDLAAPVAAPTLQKAQLFREDNRLCTRFDNDRLTMEDNSSTLCAGVSSGGIDSCAGDSGGPLMGVPTSGQGWVQVGLVSYGPQSCGTAKEFAVYTRISAYRQWIGEKTRTLTPSPVTEPNQISLPSALGLLQPIAARGGLTLDIRAPRDGRPVSTRNLAIGSAVNLRLDAEKSGDLYVFAIQSDGVVRQIAPFSGRPLSVVANQPRIFPIGGAPLRTTGPAGRHRLVAIVAPNGSSLASIFPEIVSGDSVVNPSAAQSFRNITVAKRRDRPPGPTPNPAPTPSPDLTRDWLAAVIDYQVFATP
jgi:secreted trypsin-like serine protease